MKVWALAVVLLAAVLAEKVVARPGEVDDDGEGYQDDQQAASAGPALPPKLLSAPLTLTPKPGDTIVLPCSVENVAGVSWLNKTATLAINNRRLTYANDKRLHFHPNHTLEIEDVNSGDTGSFTCKISEVLSVVHHVTVFEGNGNGAAIERLSIGLLVGAVAVLLARS